MKVKEKLIQSAYSLFLQNGIKKISITDIIENAGVSKMSFYRQFKNKDAILLEVLIQFFDSGLMEYQKLVDKKLSFVDFLNEIIVMKIYFSRQMSKAFMEEIMTTDDQTEEIQDFILNYQQKSTALFIDEILKAKANGEIGDDYSIEFLMYMMGKAQESASDTFFLNTFDSLEEAVRQVTKFYFFGIYGQRK
ncbi:TetR/AcrR family transcriptional regulator [Flammeovirga pacifica]|uniref:HTH tetR-type domain-containing protein n=1 Tax=Flammeovirga pacifica TaxID=915059 RepID=A0A1S1YT59_FLAPC|nr:TetR/AcrR family transcriptional regulator [Flammeovirga pacifica]OHX64217.1 hypothetical protein NH26_21680 [Flammeovirga pacifica]